MKTLEAKTKIISVGVLATLISFAGAICMIYLANTLWRVYPEAPGIIAFVAGGTFVVYKATMSFYTAYINVLAAEDMAG